MNNRTGVNQMVMAGLLAAMVVVGTMLIQVPTPTKGYIHIGDSMVYLCGIILSPGYGSMAAGLGSALADLLSGYAIYAPATFLIKGADALIAGIIFRSLTRNTTSSSRKLIALAIAILAGGTVMVGGYFAYETLLYGIKTAMIGIPANITQAVGGGVIVAPILVAIDRIKVLHTAHQ